MSYIVNKAKEIANKCAEKLGLEIVDVEWVKEHNIRILRIIADHPDGLTIDHSTALNEEISAKLDEEDFIEGEYYLEVSSPGLERELRNDDEIFKAINEYIYIKCYQKVDGVKEFEGYLRNFDGETVTIEINDKGRKKEIRIAKKIISLIRLAIKF
ncbi:MAG TPA: ribosome maturation factor RimP [Acholeplasmataceae bacterium]|nr:ribosome maturation factor RimP [Acholeplasmataceae bacterium]